MGNTKGKGNRESVVVTGGGGAARDGCGNVGAVEDDCPPAYGGWASRGRHVWRGKMGFGSVDCGAWGTRSGYHVAKGGRCGVGLCYRPEVEPWGSRRGANKHG